METIQRIRLLDVFVIGPVMLYAAFVSTKLEPVTRGILGVSGVLTVLYNGANFFTEEKKIQA